MRPIVAITYAYPPMRFPQSIQMYRLLGGLAEKGHPITVIHAKPESVPGQIDPSFLDIPSHPNIHRIAVDSYEKRPLVEFLYAKLRWLKYVPDGQNIWILPAYRAAKKVILGLSGSPLVITFSNPWSDHLAGLLLKRVLGIPWVAHFSDPWTDNPYVQWRSIFRRINLRLERAVIGKADKVIFVSEETRQVIMAKYPSTLLGKASVLPHLMGPEMEKHRASRPPRNGKFTLVHAGEFYGLRNPSGLLKALHLLLGKDPGIAGRITVRMVGGMDDRYIRMIEDLGLKEVVVRVQPVPYMESLGYIADADLLLIIDAASKQGSMFLPSKIVDYFSAGHPVLGLTPLKGTSARVIREMNGVVADPDDVEAILAAITGLYESHRQGTLQSKHGYDKAMADSYSIGRVAEGFSSMLEAIQSEGQG
jgi:glycosyltransferase involved in cell wall biosynthesis